MMKTKSEIQDEGFNDLGIFEVVSSRSKLRSKHRRYDSLYRERMTCTDQVNPALT